MKRTILSSLLLAAFAMAHAQDHMTPELLWSLKRVSVDGMSPDKKHVYFSSRKIDWQTEKSTTTHYRINLADGEQSKVEYPDGKKVIQRTDGVWYATSSNTLYKSEDRGDTWQSVYDGLEDADNVIVSPNGKYIAFSKEILIKPELGKDIYADLPKTTAQVYTDLNYRHWDTWEDGKFSHVFVAALNGGTAKDIMAGEPFDSPQKPFGGTEDMVWTPDSKGIVYVCKKKYGKEYAQSTNTDIYHYSLATGHTTNYTAGMMGYDTQPVFSPDGTRIAWTSMAHDGFEADKIDLYVMDLGRPGVSKVNVTEDWDGTVGSFIWSNNSSTLYFTAAWKGTEQLFEVAASDAKHKKGTTGSTVKQVTNGKFDITGIAGQYHNELVVTRTDMNHAAELYAVNDESGKMKQLTHENDDTYSNIKLSKTELRTVMTTDGKKMGVWVIYPPDFDATKKYPTLLYCQGGPQSALSQFYSVRWNFQLMAAQGYIIVAPNRRGMPGWGAKVEC